MRIIDLIHGDNIEKEVWFKTVIDLIDGSIRTSSF